MSSSPRRLVLWEYCLSPHRAAWHRALARRDGVDVTVVAQETVPLDRKKLGWEEPDYGRCRVVVAPDAPTRQRLIGPADAGTLHIFSPARTFPLIWAAFQEATTRGHRVGLLSEAHDWRGALGGVRRLRGLADRVRFGAAISFVLAIGQLAVRWYRMCGYDLERIYRFGYFVDPAEPMTVDRDSSPGAAFRLVYVGQLIRRKGVDILLRALACIRQPGWQLDVFGEGEEEGTLRRLAERLDVAERVSFRGVTGNREMRRALPAYDLLVLPSRWEGWGAVVNEALMAGVPVVCSGACGAADLVRDRRGAVFASDSVRALRRALEDRLMRGPTATEERADIRRWSRAIEGEAAAAYLLDVIAAVEGGRARPPAPWLTEESIRVRSS